MMKTFATITLLIVTIILSGCGTSVPAGFPATLPCKVSVRENGNALSGVEVSLVRQEGNGTYVISAETNSGGTALLKTRRGNYVRKGAPVGAYKIVLVRHVAVTDEELPPLPPTATPKQTKEYLQKLQILTDSRRTVPKKLSSPKTTPLTIDVAGKGSTLDIDIAEYAQTSHVTTNN